MHPACRETCWFDRNTTLPVTGTARSNLTPVSCNCRCSVGANGIDCGSATSGSRQRSFTSMCSPFLSHLCPLITSHFLNPPPVLLSSLETQLESNRSLLLTHSLAECTYSSIIFMMEACFFQGKKIKKLIVTISQFWLFFSPLQVYILQFLVYISQS